jgi:hypothetical protein
VLTFCSVRFMLLVGAECEDVDIPLQDPM